MRVLHTLSLSHACATMILGIGIDSVDIDRFDSWHQRPSTQLLRIFSVDEIGYCLSLPTKTAERFAARFAAKEALCKALHTMFPTQKLPLLTVCTHSAVAHMSNGAPYLIINWEGLGKAVPPNFPAVHLSITHTKTTATALVIIQTPSLITSSS